LIQKNLCQKINIREYIDKLNISEDNKASLKYWLDAKADGQICDDFIFGMCLALQNERKITPEDFIIITMHAPEKRKEESRWKNFWKSIRFWER
jgi:hypothetical protein